ncbi:MAG: pilus assembly PilX N-terminal domain-containing protein [Deltaproteobacteria bacterium]|nr:pilus assembly PilX N-terminal domain-containing protein [Deltaproteobacteria bacterium]
MSNIILKHPNEQGSVVVISLMILVVLTLLGIMATRTASIDIRIAANEISYKRNFYVAEAGVFREALEIGRGNYPVTNISIAYELADQVGIKPGNDTLPGSDPVHKFSGIPYAFSVWYRGYYLPPSGYSVIHFSRYDYTVDVDTPAPDTVKVASRYYKIGPKASE